MHHKDKRLEFAFTHTNTYGETYKSFVNGQYTSDGGTHQSAFREGLLKGINEFARKSFAGPDVRDGLLGAIAVKLQDPVFESQTKNKLGSTEVRNWVVQEVKDAVTVWLHKNPKVAERSDREDRRQRAAAQGAQRGQEAGPRARQGRPRSASPS